MVLYSIVPRMYLISAGEKLDSSFVVPFFLSNSKKKHVDFFASFTCFGVEKLFHTFRPKLFKPKEWQKVVQSITFFMFAGESVKRTQINNLD
jgi:hypothetical protein